MIKHILPLLLLGLSFSALAQAPLTRSSGVDEAATLAKTITADELMRHLSILASDEYEGRETGEPGQKLAAEYIAGYFKNLGLPAIGENGGYFQSIAFISDKWETIELRVGDQELTHLREFYSLPGNNTAQEKVAIDEVVFLGYGIADAAYDDYADEAVSGKTIMILSGEPRDKDGNYLVSGTSEASSWATDINEKLRVAKAKGVANVIVIDPDFKQNVADVRRKLLNNRLRMDDASVQPGSLANSIFVTPQVARQLAGSDYKKMVKARKKIEKSGKPRSATIDTDITLTQQPKVRRLLGENVLGFVEGTDPVLKDEIVVVTAHYDHIGRRGEEIFNGADDNGSGTSTVLEVAQAFTLAKQGGLGPRRSVLLMLVSGEEKGLLGSQYYVEHPIFPLENTVVDINVDMVGRVDEKHASNPDYIYVIGSNRLSTELHEINEEANRKYTNLELDYTYNAEDDPNRYYYRSDHYNFAERGIPAVFYFNGTHEDYHRASDTVDKINFAKMEKIGRLVFHTAWELANRDERIKVDVVEKP